MSWHFAVPKLPTTGAKKLWTTGWKHCYVASSRQAEEACANQRSGPRAHPKQQEKHVIERLFEGNCSSIENNTAFSDIVAAK